MVQTIQRILSQNPPLNQPKEDIFAKLIGHFGIWQFLICSAVSLVKLSSGWVQMAILFLTPNLTFWCKEFGNTNITDISTSEWENSSSIFVNSSREIVNSTCYNDCVQYEYDTGLFESTIVSEWGLVCDRQWLASFTQMALQFGILLGSILFGFLSDRFGRKLTFLLSVTSVIAFGFVIPFSTSYVIFTVSRFFLGMASAGTMVISFVIVMETVGPRYRELLGCLFQIPFIIGHMTIPLFAYYFRRWDTYSLALAVPPLIYLGYFFLLNESPRWLVSVGRVDEATEIVTKAAALNKLPTTKVKEALTELSQEILSRSEAKPNYSELFRTQLRYKTLCCCCIWLITGVTFFGLNQYISQTSPDPFVSVAAAGAIQIPSILASIWLIRQFGRKATTVAFSCFGGLCIITLGCLPATFALRLTFGTLGVSCASVVATTIYIYTSELYPTVVRNMGMGASSTAMRVGSMAAPFISNLATSVPWLPTIIFGAAPIFAGFLCIFLPETKGKVLPDSIADVEDK